ncbi:MAG: macro domain-containing protein [Saprospiraceae bacterium]|jgi:O-acetyl-ADP-ribose deacetylase (regulator of RNase III)|nr:macro domain-containing protein [Saprospiraceae bacterium]
MIKEVSGDILLSKAQAIAHGLAPNDHFDQGLALSLRKNYPSMYKDFRHYYRIAHPAPGKAWIWSGVGGVRIINLLTQEPAKGNNSHPGKASLPNVNHALKELVKIIKKEKITSLALPKLATGVGGLPWEEVKPIIYDRLSKLNIPVYFYSTYRKGIKAQEN